MSSGKKKLIKKIKNVITPQWHDKRGIRTHLRDKRFGQKRLFNRTQNIQTTERSKGLLVPISLTFQKCTRSLGQDR